MTKRDLIRIGLIIACLLAVSLLPAPARATSMALADLSLATPADFDPFSPLFYEDSVTFDLNANVVSLTATYAFSSTEEALPGFGFLPDGFSVSLLGTSTNLYDTFLFDSDLGPSPDPFTPELTYMELTNTFPGPFTAGSATGELVIDLTALRSVLGDGTTGLALTLFNEDDGFTSQASLSGIRVNSVPEPATWLMLATGLGGLAFLRRRTHARA